MLKTQQNISTNFPNFKKKINHFHFHKKIIKMITYFFIFGSNNYLRQQISFNQKRLGKNLPQIEPPDDLQLSVNLILVFAYA